MEKRGKPLKTILVLFLASILDFGSVNSGPGLMSFFDDKSTQPKVQIQEEQQNTNTLLDSLRHHTEIIPSKKPTNTPKKTKNNPKKAHKRRRWLREKKPAQTEQISEPTTELPQRQILITPQTEETSRPSFNQKVDKQPQKNINAAPKKEIEIPIPDEIKKELEQENKTVMFNLIMFHFKALSLISPTYIR